MPPLTKFLIRRCGEYWEWAFATTLATLAHEEVIHSILHTALIRDFVIGDIGRHEREEGL